MAKLLVQESNGAREFELVDLEVQIGRELDNALRLADPSISRHHAVAQVGKFEFSGFFAWLAWLFLHLVYLVGFKNRISTLLSWILTFTSNGRGQMATTSQMVYARLALEIVERQMKEAVADAEERADQLDISLERTALPDVT